MKNLTLYREVGPDPRSATERSHSLSLSLICTCSPATLPVAFRTRCTRRLYPPATERVHRLSATERFVRFATLHRKELPVVPHGYATTERLVNTATPGSRVKHPGTGPSSGSTLQAVDLQTIEGSRTEVRNTQSSRSGLRRRARRAWSLITQRTKTATYLHDDSPN